MCKAWLHKKNQNVRGTLYTFCGWISIPVQKVEISKKVLKITPTDQKKNETKLKYITELFFSTKHVKKPHSSQTTRIDSKILI